MTKVNAKNVAELAKPVLRALTEPNLSMVSQHFTLVNNVYKEKFGKNSELHEYVKKTLVLTAEERRLVIDNSSRKRLQKNENQKEIKATLIYATILKGTEPAADWRDKFIAIALACGPRLIEIASESVSEFDESKESVGLVHQAGVAKDDSGTEERGEQRHVDKPVIGITVKELLAMIQEARALVRVAFRNNQQLSTALALTKAKKISPADKQLITNRINAPLNDRVHEVLGAAYRFHDCRAIYGNFSFDLFGGNVSVVSWLSRVLGHKPGSFNAATSYSTIKILKTLPSAPVDITDRILAQDAKIEAMVNVIQREVVQQERKVEVKAALDAAVERQVKAGTVLLFNDDGKEVAFDKRPRIHDRQQMHRLRLAVTELEQKKVSITYRNLQKLGFGMRFVKALMQEKPLDLHNKRQKT